MPGTSNLATEKSGLPFPALASLNDIDALLDFAADSKAHAKVQQLLLDHVATVIPPQASEAGFLPHSDRLLIPARQKFLQFRKPFESALFELCVPSVAELRAASAHPTLVLRKRLSCLNPPGCAPAELPHDCMVIDDGDSVRHVLHADLATWRTTHLLHLNRNRLVFSDPAFARSSAGVCTFELIAMYSEFGIPSRSCNRVFSIDLSASPVHHRL